jgi:hypothetical protein
MNINPQKSQQPQPQQPQQQQQQPSQQSQYITIKQAQPGVVKTNIHDLIKSVQMRIRVSGVRPIN